MSSKTTRLENLLEAVPDALVGMDQEGVIRFVNHQTESLFGYDRDDLVGQPIQTLVPEYLWEVYSEHREEYFADPRSRSMGLDLELIGRQGDGTQFPVNITLSHIDTGDVLLRISAALEVTKRKQALENAQRMTAIVENSNDAIIGMTLNGMVTSWNAAAEKLYGHSSEEIIGKSIALLSLKDRTGEIISTLAKIKAGQPVERLETIRIRKDGTAFPVSSASHRSRGRRRRRRSLDPPRSDRTKAGVRGRPAHRGDRRGFGRCHLRRHARRHRHQLEPGRREDVRLPKPRDHRQVLRPPRSRGSNERDKSHPGQGHRWQDCRAPRNHPGPKERNDVPGLADHLSDPRRGLRDHRRIHDRP